MLGFGGRFLTKARHYPVTFTALRQARITYRRNQDTGPDYTPIDRQDEVDTETAIVVTRLSYAGSGWSSFGDALLANTAADLARRRRQVAREEIADLVLILGLRRGEVLGLAWDQIDLDAGELYVDEQLQRVRHQLVLREVKTETSEAPLPLPDPCVAALRIRKRRQDEDRKAAGDGWIDNGLVFTTRHGTPIEPRNFNRGFDRWIRVGRVPRITVHGTRKTCGSLLAALDVHPRVAMRILRHSKINLTMEIYTETTSEATREALRKLGDLFA